MRTLTDIKRDLVAAHRAGDQEAMRRLSQEKERAKKGARRFCCDCGQPIRGAHRCLWHHRLHRYYQRTLNSVGELRT